ncbi:putative bifunctional NMN adenylyltransferase/NUDIX hydrolase protein [Rhizobium phage RHph_TM39]|uniref:Putative bifunctional NMN adenylyltransferase/NUDIX hydrolase protein n=1 Tax=Rhizobium phage RHph_TM30 TaxID=2509764 RepID=A0A7S5R4W4_9CAUD|nr:cytidyltransferase [Rhizobium phage RHph_TM30]QIG71120.1 putative bifunctional NMN adenylyltransferase/NUDIX hydrolase protein [Rhizobium phage RHph_TM30]QIG77001.1 putative bifunctional NMN adenylyltransferase/NUDIX hydrolase protein [Rhizobium phage RHph_TM39]QIG77342.1 putative bifunctional NMN adenylyltransferase/NUDIX hydrolase protein [Rhizobium phage RHph_TM21B]QIG77600.1 putative bifunctional NMN adenylyltransferase/NUDIX hydrolase protein [Rhizobium phage RHph_TM61]
MIFSLSNSEYFSLADAVCTAEDSQGRVPVNKNIVRKLITYLEAEKFFNLGTVCCVLLPVEDGLLLIRRNRKSDPGFGMVALPGGFQKGKQAQNMYDAAVEEVLEETGIVIHKENLKLVYGDTDEYEHNVLFFLHNGLLGKASMYIEKFVPSDDEVSELVYITEPVDTAFPMHSEQIKKFFEKKFARR